MNKELYYLAFSHFLGIGPIRFRTLLNRFYSAEKAYKANQKDLEKTLGINLTEKFIQFRRQFNPLKKLEEIKKLRIKILCFDDVSYPVALKNITDPPICLYVKGEINSYNFNLSSNGDNFIAIVGTRTPTAYGRQVAKIFSKELSDAGFVIISGLAIGIDTLAHQGALENKNRTIAVLGCGVDVIYPWTNHQLYQQIIQENGLIISEFPPRHLVKKGLFVARNRLISGLSRGVLVIEGAEDSGALITAKYAAFQGKEVFAPPGPLTSRMSQAPNLLLKQGAKLVTSIDDILEEFNLQLLPKKKQISKMKLSDGEKRIFEILLREPKLADELVVQLQLGIDIILNNLSLMEIKGIVEKNSEGRYQLKRNS